MNFDEIEKEATKYRAARAALLPAAQKKVDLIEELLEKSALEAQLAVTATWDSYRLRKIDMVTAQTKVSSTWSRHAARKRKALADIKAIWTEYKKATKVKFPYAGM